MGLLLDLTIASLRSILYYEKYIVIDPGDTDLKPMELLTEEEFLEAKERYGMSFSAGNLAEEIKKIIPDFTCEFNPDFRQKIADTWPQTIDDSAAREEWGWAPDYNLARMTMEMISVLNERKAEGNLNY